MDVSTHYCTRRPISSLGHPVVKTLLVPPLLRAGGRPRPRKVTAQSPVACLSLRVTLPDPHCAVGLRDALPQRRGWGAAGEPLWAFHLTLH